jgi:hypothetical protein
MNEIDMMKEELSKSRESLETRNSILDRTVRRLEQENRKLQVVTDFTKQISPSVYVFECEWSSDQNLARFDRAGRLEGGREPQRGAPRPGTGADSARADRRLCASVFTGAKGPLSTGGVKSGEWGGVRFERMHGAILEAAQLPHKQATQK